MRDIKRILLDAVDGWCGEGQISNEEDEYANEWIENNVADPSPPVTPLEKKLEHEMHSEYVRDGDIRARNYALTQEEWDSLPDIDEHSYHRFDCGWGSYILRPPK